jgi:DNA-binding NarL/FixJ family response regulator
MKLLDTEDGIEVVGEAADGVEAVALARRLQPDVLLMDIRMPNLDGIEATRRLTSQTDTKVLILTTYDLDEYVFEALRAGASGFLLKDSPADLLTGRDRDGRPRGRAARTIDHPAAHRPICPPTVASTPAAPTRSDRSRDRSPRPYGSRRV